MPSPGNLFRNKQRLTEVLDSLPAAPGVYRFFNPGGKLIYVGKSVRLRDRVRSYFTGKAADYKVRRLRQEVSSLDWEVTGSELEALLLESRLVKQHQPRFNSQLRGFIPLSYVRIDRGDPYPRLEVTREPQRDGAAYYGPFRSFHALERGVAALDNALGLRNCDGHGASLPGRLPCYRMELGKCVGPCALPDAGAAYAAALERACRTLAGEDRETLELLRGRMERAAEAHRFELAARLRDAMEQIRGISGRQQALHSAMEGLSLVVLCPARAPENWCAFVFRRGRLALQATLPRADLRRAASCRAWARRFAAAGTDLAATEELDAATLDEIQIVTGWMRRNTGEGVCHPLPEGPPSRHHEAALTAWLRSLSPSETARRAA